MLMGQQTHLPVRMTVYSGSIRDVSTLETTMGQLGPRGDENILVVMDKGFTSRSNINGLLGRENTRFLMSLPMTMGFAKRQLEAERGRIDTLRNTIVSGADILRGVSKERAWSKGRKLYVHVFYNDIKATAVKNSLYGHVRKLVEAAEADPHNGLLKKQYERYLIIRRSQKRESGYTVNVREDVVERELAHAGWLVTVSNHISDAAEAIGIYRAKDVVEKGFMRLKGSLGLDRLRVHSQEAMESKVFVGFIALILLSRIHHTMLEKGLYEKMTMKELIRTLEKLRTQVIDDRRILFPLTRKQKDIYRAFDILPPA
jgi:transposase